MFHLDDMELMRRIDAHNLYPEMEGLPEQLLAAWELGNRYSLPTWNGIRQILVAGMGGSAIAADLLAGWVEKKFPVPYVVHRDYDLPAWARGKDTLVIASSHSGNTEETLSAFDQAYQRGCRILAITTGGTLAELAAEKEAPVWKFEHHGQPRMAVGWSFGLLLAAIFRLGLHLDPSAELAAALELMRLQRSALSMEQPAHYNPAKRLAGQLYDRYVMVIGSGVLAPVARRWKGQINELAKAWAGFEFLPEADHNSLAGIFNPQSILEKMMIIFLQASSDHPRNRRRADLTRKTFMLEGLGTDTYYAPGETSLSNQWGALQFGDYLAFYLAMAYQVDPTPIDVIQVFKTELNML